MNEWICESIKFSWAYDELAFVEQCAMITYEYIHQCVWVGVRMNKVCFVVFVKDQAMLNVVSSKEIQ